MDSNTAKSAAGAPMLIASRLSEAEASLLLLVDIQPGLTAAMESDERENMLTNSGILLQAARVLEIPVLVTEQTLNGLGSTDVCLREKLPENTRIFEKTGFSCLRAPGFEDALKASGRRQIVMVGQEAHVCLLQSALELQERGYRVFLVEDAVCARNMKHKIFAVDRMHQDGVTITNYESVLFEWLRDSAHPQFANLAKLIH